MAPRRIHLGRLVAVAACLAVAVTGCGGGSSSAPGPAGAGPTTTTKSTAQSGTGEGGTTATTEKGSSAQAKPEKGSGSTKAKATEGEGGGEKKYEKKHPPLELPTGKPEKGPTKAQQERVPTADIAVTIPGGLTAANTCQGKELSPAISWGKVPSGTSELAIFAMSVKPVDGKLYFDWALAGIDPSLTGLKEGEVPKGAVPGRNSAGKNGYSLCPPASESEAYIFAVYALSSGLSPKPGFEPLALRKQAGAASHEVGITGVTFGG